jgi:hypothetical protein
MRRADQLIVLVLLVTVIVPIAFSQILKQVAIPSSGTISLVDPSIDSAFKVGVYDSTQYSVENVTTGETVWVGTSVNDMFNFCFDHLNGGGTIFVARGTYYGFVEIVDRDYITIVGEDREHTIIHMPDGTQRNNLLLWSSDYVTISNLKLFGNRAGNPYQGRISLQNGVWIEGCDYLVIDDIIVENTPRQGLELNTRSSLGGGHHVEIKNSLFADCGWNGVTIVIKSPGEQIVVDNCTATGVTDLGFSVYDGAGVVIKNCRAYSNWGMERGNPTHSGFGVEHDETTYVDPGNGPTFIDCEAWDNYAGFYALHYSDSVPTYINSSSHDNEWGIRWASYATGSIVFDGCRIFNNTSSDLRATTSNALFEFRNGEINKLYISGTNRGCKVFHNNVMSPEIIISDAVVLWDDGYPSGGNYWGNYGGEDSYSGPNQDQPGSDGILDSPYVVDSDNEDAYPVVSPFL